MDKVTSGTQELRNERSDAHGGGMDWPVKANAGQSAIVCAAVMVRLHQDNSDDE